MEKIETLKLYSNWASTLAAKYAIKFRKYSQPFDVDDLTQEALLAILEAAERFDKKRHVPFKTFAASRVFGRMQDYIREVTKDRRKSNRGVVFIPLDDVYWDKSEYTLDEFSSINEAPEMVVDPKDSFEHYLQFLSILEKRILRYYYFDDLSFKALSEKVGLSESRVNQIHSQLMKKLKSRITKKSSPHDLIIANKIVCFTGVKD